MAREPLMTLTELAREKQVNNSSSFNTWAKRVPLPPQEILIDRQGYKNNACGKKFYKRSSLLDWYERAKP
jgi:hypothetical protein